MPSVGSSLTALVSIKRCLRNIRQPLDAATGLRRGPSLEQHQIHSNHRGVSRETRQSYTTMDNDESSSGFDAQDELFLTDFRFRLRSA